MCFSVIANTLIEILQTLLGRSVVIADKQGVPKKTNFQNHRCGPTIHPSPQAWLAGSGDLSDVSACRMMILKVRFLGHPVVVEEQGCISCGTCSYLELTEDHVLTSAYVKIVRIVTRNDVNKSVSRKKDYSWHPLNKHAMNIWLSSLRIRAHLSWRTGKHLHVLHVLRTYSTCSYPRY